MNKTLFANAYLIYLSSSQVLHQVYREKLQFVQDKNSPNLLYSCV